MLSASNEWPQIREGEEDHDQRSLNNKNKMMMMVASKEGEEGNNKVMEKPSQEQIQQQQQQLKCPRCDSTNTKFCYYNNYSLTQPRHFCKACKRYWTRGGTLRTVPVGGGCRKNKRVRRPTPNPHPHSSSNTTTNTNSSSNTNISEPSSNTLFHLNPSGIGGGGGGHLISSPFLYGLPTNLLPPNHHHHSNSSPHESIINGFPFSSYNESDHHLGGLGLGFSGILGGGDHGGIRNGKQILQDLMISNSNPSFHGSNSNTTTNTTTTTTSTTTMPMSSLLTSSCLQQQKFNFESLFPYELDLQIKGVGSHGSEGVFMKDQDSVKVEDGDHQPHGQCQIQNGYDQIHNHQQPPMGESQDPSMLWNNNNHNTNGNSIGVNWLDPNNYSSIGSSSVPSLI